MRRQRLLLTVAAASLVLATAARFGLDQAGEGAGRPGAPTPPRPQATRSAPARGATRDRVAAPDARGPAAADAALPLGGASAPGAPAVPVVAGRHILFPHDAAPRPGDLAAVARALLDENRERLGLDRVPGELRVAREFTSLSGHHLRFRQFVGGVPVEGSEVSVHVAPDGRPLLLAVSVFPVAGADTEPRVTAEQAVAAARSFLCAEGEDEVSEEPSPGDPRADGPEEAPAAARAAAAEKPAFEHGEPRLFVLPEGRDGRLVWRIDASTADETARVSVDARDGEVVATRDLRIAADGQAQVFDPNPVASTRNVLLSDRLDKDSGALTAARTLVVLPRLDGTGRIRGAWCDAARGSGNVASASLDWTNLTRSSDGFEAVNAYYHIDRTQALLQELGIVGVNASSQRIDVHGLTIDQSYFDVVKDLILFGDGGVDDAEDGDIVVHEYGHAIQNDQVEEFGATWEGAAIGEGFADFLACTLHSPRTGASDPVWGPLVAAWDATSYSSANPPYLRRVDGSKTYPDDLTDQPHDDGEIWSAFLWRLRELVGADDALRVAVESHAFLDSGARFFHAANAVLAANAAIRDGRDDAAIRALLRARGIPFSRPPVDAPPEDPWEENDAAESAAPVELGTLEDLLLADEDWFQVQVPPFRRLRAQADFEPAEVDVDLEIRSAAGALLGASKGVSGAEVAHAVSGSAGAPFLVRAYPGASRGGVAGYRLVLQDVPLERLKGGRTTLRRTTAGVADAVEFAVLPAKAGARSRLVLRSLSQARGSVNDLRVVSPSGTVVAQPGAGRTRRGTRLAVALTEPGNWRIEVLPRDGTAGRYSIQASVQRR